MAIYYILKNSQTYKHSSLKINPLNFDLNIHTKKIVDRLASTKCIVYHCSTKHIVFLP